MTGMPVNAAWDQDRYQFFTPDGNWNDALTSLAALNTVPADIAFDTDFIVWIGVEEIGGSNQAETPFFDWEYRVNGGTWTNVAAAGSNNPVRCADNANLTNGVTALNQRITSGTYVDGDGLDAKTGAIRTNLLGATGGNDWYELAISIDFPSTVTSPLTAGDTVEFRLKVVDGNLNTAVTAFDVNGGTYTNIPSVDVAAAGTNVAAGPETLTITENQAVISLDVDVAAGPETLAIAENQAGIALNVDISAGPETLTVTENPATVTVVTPAQWDQDSYRFRNDDGSETAATWMAAANTVPPDIDFDTNFRLRYLVQETAGSNQSEVPTFRLHYRRNGGAWTLVEGSANTFEPVRCALSTHLTDEAAATQQLGSGTFRDGQVLEQNSTGTALTATSGNDEYELEWCLIFDSTATSPASAGDLFEFRPRLNTGSGFVTAGTFTNDASVSVLSADVDVQAGPETLAIAENQAAITLDVDVSAGPETLTVTENQATLTLDVDVTAGPETLNITENPASLTFDVDVQSGPEVLNVTENQAAIVFDVDVSAGPETLNITENSATVSLGVNIDAGPETLAIAENLATITLDVNLTAGPETLTIAENPASITLDVGIDAGPETLNITENAATLVFDVDVTAGPETLAITENAAAITLDVEVTAGPETLTITEHTATVSTVNNVDIDAGPETLAITENAAVIALDVDVAAGPEALTITENPASVALDVDVTAGPEAITITENTAGVSLDVDVTAGPETLNIFEHQATITGAVNVDVTAGPETLELITFKAAILFDGDTRQPGAAWPAPSGYYNYPSKKPDEPEVEDAIERVLEVVEDNDYRISPKQLARMVNAMVRREDVPVADITATQEAIDRLQRLIEREESRKAIERQAAELAFLMAYQDLQMALDDEEALLLLAAI